MMPVTFFQSACTRQLVAVQDCNEARDRAAGWIRGLAARFSVAWFGFAVPPGIPAVPPAQAANWLGREYDALVFDARSDLHADALAIAAGLLRGGGVLLLIVAEAGRSPFARRFERFLAEPVVQWAHPGSTLPCPLPVRREYRLRLNEGQRRAFRSMLPLPDLPDHASFVLTAPRGRGKSTLLGALVRHWRNVGVAGVRVTAPNPAAITSLLRVLGHDSGATFPAGVQDTEVYVAPDRLLAGDVEPSVLLVDEAAALPVHRLLALASRVPRTVFATTTTGFEGSGRGFRLRFLRALRRRGPLLRELELGPPVRWSAGDTLEDWINRLFLLNVETPAVPAGARKRFSVARRRVTWTSGTRLAGNEATLAEVVGLLSDAHYRTRPSDLRRWIDDPALSIGLLRGPGRLLLGVMLLLSEPGLDPGLARSVWLGERRPAGQFLPAVLAAHGAFDVAGHPALRVVRIAVHPGWQRRGIGRRMLGAADRYARRLGFAMLGASFGADSELLDFWGSAGYRPLRVGFRRETTSGLHATVVLRPVGSRLEPELQRLRAEISGDWPVWRAGPLRDLEPDVADAVLRSLPSPAGPDPVADQEQAHAFACRQRPYELALPALRRWLVRDTAMLQVLSPGDRQLLEASIMRFEDWPSLFKLTGESGRAGVIRVLRRSLRPALGESPWWDLWPMDAR
jgi:tRNA(Met) cytidine acetyltransferase